MFVKNVKKKTKYQLIPQDIAGNKHIRIVFNAILCKNKCVETFYLQADLQLIIN